MPRGATCTICCDSRLTPASTVSCGVCDHVCCKSCVKRFLLDLMDDPQCMQCRRRFTHAELIEKLPRTFVDGDLKRHRAEVLLDRQKAMVPASQNAVVVERERRQSLKRIREWEEEREQLKRELRRCNMQINDEYYRMSRPAQSERRQFVMKCAREACHGFLNEQYRCSVCEGATCAQCHVYVGNAPDGRHVCNPDDVATVALLRRDSKRCPSCSTWIHRYEGCTQMFCTNPTCHALFDYRTLRLLGDRDHVHNPHYTEWLARQRTRGVVAREAGDIPCGGMPHIHELYRAIVPQHLVGAPPERTQRILWSHRMVMHVEHETLPRYRVNVDEPELEQMRVQFCLGDFDEAAWRTRLQRREKDRSKKYEITLVLEMVVHACGDLFRQMVLAATTPAAASSREPPRSVEQVHDDILAVLSHAGIALCRIAVAFNCTVPYVNAETQRIPLISATAAKNVLQGGTI